MNGDGTTEREQGRNEGDGDGGQMGTETGWRLGRSVAW
jgi:hypothetical protein